jgi:hypothetical protein
MLAAPGAVLALIGCAAPALQRGGCLCLAGWAGLGPAERELQKPTGAALLWLVGVRWKWARASGRELAAGSLRLWGSRCSGGEAGSEWLQSRGRCTPGSGRPAKNQKIQPGVRRCRQSAGTVQFGTACRIQTQCLRDAETRSRGRSRWGLHAAHRKVGGCWERRAEESEGGREENLGCAEATR